MGGVGGGVTNIGVCRLHGAFLSSLFGGVVLRLEKTGSILFLWYVFCFVCEAVGKIDLYI